MDSTYGIATLNINGIAARHRIRMLEDFFHTQDIDVLCVQELTNVNIQAVRQYMAHLNIGGGGRGTAILVKEAHILGNIRRLPSGRGMMTTFNGVDIAKFMHRRARGGGRRGILQFRRASALGNPPTSLLLAGDFNCVLTANDCTGSPNVSRTLTNLIKGLAMVDTWEQQHGNRRYAHYTALRASRIDSIYATRNMLGKKTIHGDTGCGVHRPSRCDTQHTVRSPGGHTREGTVEIKRIPAER
jgi:exonuclease III